jgi:DNA-directed RNA polymerase specialized sigma24 family protein
MSDGDDASEGLASGLADTLADDSPLAEDALSDLQQLDLLRHGLDRLDTRCRDLLRLLFADDDERPAYDEVARRMAMPVGSIGPTRARCLGKLRALVEPGPRR